MPEPRTLYRLFNNFLTESKRVAIMREARIEDDRPSILRGEAGQTQEGVEWIARHRESVAPLILRYIDPPDDLIAGLVTDGDLQIPAESRSPQTIILSGLTVSESGSARQSLSLSDILGSSAIVFQAFLDLSAANEACGARSSLPEVELSRGSVQITVGRGLHSSGIGLLVTCSAGLVGAPLAGTIAGASLATAGIVELAVGWRKAIAENRKLDTDTSKTDAQHRQTEINIQIKELDLERARLEKDHVMDHDSSGRPMSRPRQNALSRTPPESGEVPRASVRQNAEALAMSEIYANHVLNRALPNFRLLKQKMSGAEVRLLSPLINPRMINPRKRRPKSR